MNKIVLKSLRNIFIIILGSFIIVGFFGVLNFVSCWNFDNFELSKLTIGGFIGSVETGISFIHSNINRDELKNYSNNLVYYCHDDFCKALLIYNDMNNFLYE